MVPFFKKITRVLNILPLAALLVAGSVSAQYVGPSDTPAYKSVAEVLKTPVDDAPVTLEGYLIKKVGSDKYIFSDGVSQIRVEIDRRYFPVTPITETTKIRIRGEVEKEFLETPEIDVNYLEIISNR